MGRWAQSRHRGGGGNQAGIFSLEPPVVDVDWSVAGTDGAISVQTSSPFPAPADLINFRWRVTPAVPWDETTSLGVSDLVDLSGPQTVGKNVEIQTRYLHGVIVLSDWSATTNAVIT